MEPLVAQILGLYLLIALPPVVVAWRRGLSAVAIRRSFVVGVLFGWTLVGAAWAWIVALDDRPGVRVTLLIR